MSFSGTRTWEETQKMLATKLLFEQETWLVGWCICAFFFFFLRVENCEIQTTAKNPFCAVCEPCKCCISLVSSQRSQLFMTVCKFYHWWLRGY